MKKWEMEDNEYLGLADIPKNNIFTLNLQTEIEVGFDGFNQEF